MPKHGDNITRTAAGRWEVQFKVKETVQGADGVAITKWRGKRRAFDTFEEAERFKRDAKTTAARGEVWTDKRNDAVATLGTIVDAYAAAPTNERTKAWRKAVLGGKKKNGERGANTFAAFAGADLPVSGLTVKLLKDYAASLPSEGREASTKHRKVAAVEAMWTWAYDPRNRATYPGVPEPVRVTADGVNDVNAPVQPPMAVVRIAVPEVHDVDAMIGRINNDGWEHGGSHRRVALLCRYVGLRIAQAVNLNWRDVRLDSPAGPYLVIRAGGRGAKKGSARVVPLHPALAAEMATWGVREGSVFPATNERWIRGESTREAFRVAWERASLPADDGGVGMDRAKWDGTGADDGERGHASPTHAIRAAVLTAMLRGGVSLDVANYAIGHASGATKGAYVPEASPEASPWWPMLVKAVATIPDHREYREALAFKRAVAK